MLLRLWCVLLLVAGLGLCGCDLKTETPADEQKNEFFKLGKERAEAGEYRGAIEAFEKALESNPRSALAHYELAVLYDKHGDQKNDYVCAMYHYLQVIKLRPKEYPAENARQRVIACKQELVKAESLAPVAGSLFRELERMKEENQRLAKQLEAAKAQLAAPPPGSPGNPGVTANRTGNSPPTRQEAVARSTPPDGVRITPLPPSSASRTHTVKQRETPFSIARQYGIKLDALMAANPGLNAKKMKVGQNLTIPSS